MTDSGVHGPSISDDGLEPRLQELAKMMEHYGKLEEYDRSELFIDMLKELLTGHAYCDLCEGRAGNILLLPLSRTFDWKDVVDPTTRTQSRTKRCTVEWTYLCTTCGDKCKVPTSFGFNLTKIGGESL